MTFVCVANGGAARNGSKEFYTLSLHISLQEIDRKVVYCPSMCATVRSIKKYGQLLVEIVYGNISVGGFEMLKEIYSVQCTLIALIFIPLLILWKSLEFVTRKNSEQYNNFYLC